jgi:hypothetical protein
MGLYGLITGKKYFSGLSFILLITVILVFILKAFF